MKRNRVQPLILLVFVYFLIFLSIILKSKFLILIGTALLLLYFALKNSKKKKYPQNISNSSDSDYIRLVRIIFSLICIPFIVVGITLLIFGLINHENFLTLFGLMFFTIPLIIFISSMKMTSKMNQISFDELGQETNSTKSEKKSIHDEHDEFLNEYSNKNKECFEHEAKPKKKKKFKFFNEPEWDDEDIPLDL